jgi:hypothetical protein
VEGNSVQQQLLFGSISDEHDAQRVRAQALTAVEAQISEVLIVVEDDESS